LTTGGGGGSFARAAFAASVMALRRLTAAADISGNLGINTLFQFALYGKRELSAENGHPRGDRDAFHDGRVS